MTERTSTPGPWQATIDASGNIVRAADSTGRPIASMWMNGDDMLCNARLIAAAPDLLEELKAMVETFSGYQGMELKRAKAAIAKAEGEKSAADEHCPI